MTDLNTSEPAAEPDDTSLARMLDPKAFQPPAEEPPKTFDSTPHGLGQAADELTERRAKPEPAVKRWSLGDDAPKTLSAKDAAERLTFSRKGHKALERNLRTPGEDPWVSGRITALQEEAEAEPNPIEYQNKAKHETVSLREAASDLARYRSETAPAEASTSRHRHRPDVRDARAVTTGGAGYVLEREAGRI